MTNIIRIEFTHYKQTLEDKLRNLLREEGYTWWSWGYQGEIRFMEGRKDAEVYQEHFECGNPNCLVCRTD